MEKKQLLGIIGSVTLFLGVFFPVIGSYTAFNQGKGFGVILIILAINSMILSWAKRYKGLYITSLSSLVLILCMFVYFSTVLNRVRQQLEADLADNPFRSIADYMLQSFKPEFGWIIIITGSLIIFISAALKE
ncbi:hypothetical protein [Legionella spiritensis]|uniref:Transmembrane protein n=1 Tax=Legionella spiritensis TaxID=452 RepID=A0A0W0Z592_LEGSP|nr:hypothetical protein [Legionella spiritensis]KTD64257.1 hypothetical protein Lspi_1064 [Legionella spiritensis]SNV47092.1 Uncharacterised protein [Legionella spiritensis]